MVPARPRSRLRGMLERASGLGMPMEPAMGGVRDGRRPSGRAVLRSVVRAVPMRGRAYQRSCRTRYRRTDGFREGGHGLPAHLRRRRARRDRRPERDPDPARPEPAKPAGPGRRLGPGDRARDDRRPRPQREPGRAVQERAHRAVGSSASPPRTSPEVRPDRSTTRPARSAAPSPVPGSTGNPPKPWKNADHSRPLNSPRFAMNVTGRGQATTSSGTSSIERWLAATMTGPRAGTCRHAATRSRKSDRKKPAGAGLSPAPGTVRGRSGTREPMCCTLPSRVQSPPSGVRARRGGSRIGHRGTAGGRPPPGARPQRPGRAGDVPDHGHRPPVRRGAVPTQPAGQGAVRRPRLRPRGVPGGVRRGRSTAARTGSSPTTATWRCAW